MPTRKSSLNPRKSKISTISSFPPNHFFPKELITNSYKQVEIIPKNKTQKYYLDCLKDSHHSIVIATGPAGTGKSFLCTLFAIKQLQAGIVEKIIIMRPAVGVDDEDHGFLPGTLTEKMYPWVQPILDIFKEYYYLPTLTKLIECGVIEFVPISFVRGRTFKNAFVIFDEAQNSLPNSMKAVLTRIGENCRIFVTGDMTQHDKGYAINGLRDFIDKLKRSPSDKIVVCEFTNKDIERHPCVVDVLEIYGDFT